MNGSCSTASWFRAASSTIGASLTFSTSIENVCDAVPPRPSSTVTETSTVPTAAWPGVPAKVRVPGSNESHSGSGEPSARVADQASSSPSASSNASDGTVKENGASSAVVRSAIDGPASGAVLASGAGPVATPPAVITTRVGS